MRKKSKKGMTLIELIISLALLAIILIPISNFIIVSIKNTVKSEEKQKATFIGQKFLEELNSYDEILLEKNKETMINGFKLLDGELIKEIDKVYNGSFKKNNYDVEIEIKKDESFNKKPINNLNNLSSGKSLIFTLENTSITSSERDESNEDKVKFKDLNSTSYDSNLSISLNYSFYENKKVTASEDEVNSDNEESILEEDELDINKGNYNTDELEISIDSHNNLENYSKFKIDKKDTIIIYLEEDFSKDIEIYIANNTDEAKNIYVIKNNKSVGKVSVYSNGGKVILNKERKLLEEDLEDKYIISVKIRKDKKILFEGESSSNLIIR